MTIAEPLRPVERQTLAKVVMEQLLAFIREGGIAPGQPLPSQHELARRLSVSRPVLREAIHGLATIGVVDVRPGSGCYVRDPAAGTDLDSLLEQTTHETALEVLEARMVVEVELAVLAAQRATHDDRAGMLRVLGRLERAVRAGEPTAEITSAFHEQLARAAHNAVLYRMAHALTRARVEQGRRVEDALPDAGSGEYESHLALYRALDSGDPERARTSMREHLEVAHRWEERIASARLATAPPAR